jgi:hypothetical protein
MEHLFQIGQHVKHRSTGEIGIVESCGEHLTGNTLTLVCWVLFEGQTKSIPVAESDLLPALLD